MGTLPEIIEEIIRADNAGIITDEQKDDNDFLEALANEYRAQAIFDIYAKTKRINPAWTQQMVIDYDPQIQESDCYLLFPAPNPISLGPLMDGHIYIGSDCGAINYPKARSRADLANRNNHRHTRVKIDKPKVLFSDGCYEVYGNMMLRKLMVDGINSYPTEVPTYNKYIDPYPISPDVLIMMKSYVIKETAQPTNTPADTKSDSQHTTTSINAQK